jgi:hypothetical protein
MGACTNVMQQNRTHAFEGSPLWRQRVAMLSYPYHHPSTFAVAAVAVVAVAAAAAPGTPRAATTDSLARTAFACSSSSSPFCSRRTSSARTRRDRAALLCSGVSSPDASRRRSSASTFSARIFFCSAAVCALYQVRNSLNWIKPSLSSSMLSKLASNSSSESSRPKLTNSSLKDWVRTARRPYPEWAARRAPRPLPPLGRRRAPSRLT